MDNKDIYLNSMEWAEENHTQIIFETETCCFKITEKPVAENSENSEKSPPCGVKHKKEN
jgi:hypothetical protein